MILSSFQQGWEGRRREGREGGREGEKGREKKKERNVTVHEKVWILYNTVNNSIFFIFIL